MQKNILAELSTLLDDLNFSGSGSYWEGADNEALKVFERLVKYVRLCTWSDNDTTKFVACNFTHEQNSMPELWHSMYPTKPEKAQSTFRTQYQAINKYLEHVLPQNLTKLFAERNEVELKLLSEKIDSLYMNDTNIDAQLGGQLCCLLSKLDLSYKKFSVSECMQELRAMRLLSVARNIEMLETCDEHKLAYCYHVMTRPPVVAGKLNTRRLEFIQAMLSMDSGVHLESIDSHVVDESYLLLSVAKNIADLMSADTNVSRILELCKLAIENYACESNSILVKGLNECYDLLRSGNQIDGVRNILLKYIGDYVGIVSHSSEPVGVASTDIDFHAMLEGRDADYVMELINKIRSACTDLGIELEGQNEPVLMTTGALDIVRSIASDVELTDEAMLNTDVVNFLHLHCTKTGITRGLSKYNPEDVAYIVSQIDSGNTDLLNAVKNGINIDSINKIGDIEMLSDVKNEIESRIETADPSEFITDLPLGIIRDYTTQGMKLRFDSVSNSDLARVYYDILNRDEDTMEYLAL